MTFGQQHVQELRQGCTKLGIDLADAQCSALIGYLELLCKWNRAYNLTAVRDPDEMVSRHLLDSLSILSSVPATAQSFLDVGSGGGMPGIPLAIMYPQRSVTVLDSNGKKSRFLLQAKLELGLDNLEVVNARVEAFQKADGFDCIVSRAFSSLANFSGWTRHLGHPETTWLAMKGAPEADELAGLPEDFRLEEARTLAVPGCQGQRHLLILRRTGHPDSE